MTDTIKIRYIGLKNGETEPVTGLKYHWPKRGSVIDVQKGGIEVKLLAHPTCFVVADSDSDPMKGESHEGMDPIDGNAPMTVEEQIIGLAIQIINLGGEELAVDVFNGQHETETPEQNNQGNSLGNDLLDTVNAALQIMCDNDPEHANPEYFTQAGIPRVEAIESLTRTPGADVGIIITADERDDMWEAFVKENAG
ncbi:MAG TPA: hypothetical protein ENJ24_01850 [Gammaproteobacteria bacterium]|nr:hypothetical protein [Gammaproteobacteria bacterium]